MSLMIDAGYFPNAGGRNTNGAWRKPSGTQTVRLFMAKLTSLLNRLASTCRQTLFPRIMFTFAFLLFYSKQAAAESKTKSPAACFVCCACTYSYKQCA